MSATRDHTELRKARRALRKVKSTYPGKDATDSQLAAYTDKLAAATAAYVTLLTPAIQTPNHVRVPCVACGTAVKLYVHDLSSLDSYCTVEEQSIVAALVHGESLCSSCEPLCIVCNTSLHRVCINSKTKLPVIDHWESCGPSDGDGSGFSAGCGSSPRTGCKNHLDRTRAAKGCYKCHASLAVARAAMKKIAHSSE